MSSVAISVVVPAYNARMWIREAIESTLSQTLAPAEILVVDDGSTDDTPAVLAEYGTKIRCITQPNRGVAFARNVGIRLATGEFIAILDADDVWHPRKLELQARVMREHPSIATLGTRVFDWPTRNMPSVECEGLPRVTVVDRNALAVKNYLAASSVMIRRDVIERIGGFDVQLQGAADHDCWLRAAEIADVGNLELPLMGYRSLAGSMSKQAHAMEADMRRILTKLDASDYWRGDRLLRRRAHSYVSYSCAYLHGAAGDQVGALKQLLKSLAWYPLPYSRAEAGVGLGRARRLTVQVLRLARVMHPDPGC
jgi:glycosyltransferase involved in cell wall biosynthesis